MMPYKTNFRKKSGNEIGYSKLRSKNFYGKKLIYSMEQKKRAPLAIKTLDPKQVKSGTVGAGLGNQCLMGWSNIWKNSEIRAHHPKKTIQDL